MGQEPNNPISVSERLESFRRWAKLKQYQIEVTYAVNTYTPLEKVFYSLVLILFTLSVAGFAHYILPRVLGPVYSIWYILSQDIHQIASHIGTSNKMAHIASHGPIASPFESQVLSL
ncbi:hypothetical protein PG996_006778 [Apiospora saccharicola]|uniref:Uncharacterized protein n=1 Tax=Apiospora saccharicola TaxID=335842 RepID=A0ABR1V8Z9_9PEZI